MSSYHGGEMEGPSVRRLMCNGKEVFSAIETFLLDTNISENFLVSHSDIHSCCHDYGSIFLLLDSAISLLNTRRGHVTDNIVSTLQERLQLLSTEWIRINFSITPKLYILLNHSIPQLSVNQDSQTWKQTHLRERTKREYAMKKDFSG